MSNLASSLFKMVALAGGAVVGTLIARWMEEAITAKAEERSQYDKMRYAQGLGPLELQRNVEVQQEEK